MIQICHSFPYENVNSLLYGRSKTNICLIRAVGINEEERARFHTPPVSGDAVAYSSNILILCHLRLGALSCHMPHQETNLTCMRTAAKLSPALGAVHSSWC